MKNQMRELGMIEQQAIAALACNATAAFVKVHGGWPGITWQASTPENAGQMVRVVESIETGLRDGIPTFMNPSVQDETDVPRLFGPPAYFFLGVAEAAVKIETGWKAPKPEPAEVLYTRIDRTIEGLVARAVGEMSVPKLVRLSPQLCKAWSARTNRIAVVSSNEDQTRFVFPDQADFCKVWTAKGDVAVREDRSLRSDDSVLLMATSPDGGTVCFAAAVK